MARLLILLVILVIGWRMFTGRWPWQLGRRSAGEQSLRDARKLLEVGARATREEILSAHRRLATVAHPDRGGTAQQMHQANEARDLLLGQLQVPPPSKPPQEPQ